MVRLLARLLLATISPLASLALWKLFWFMYYQLSSPLRHLRGPKSKSFIYGSIEDMRNPEGPGLYEEWARDYGSTMKYKGFFGRDHLFTLDTRAINYILTHNHDYQKHPILRYHLAQIFGEGLLVVEGAQHRQQRRILSPAFGQGQIRALTDIFYEKAFRLCSLWLSEITNESTTTTTTTTTTTGARIDVVPWLSRTTLDVIGLTGFNYDFKSLDMNSQPNELNDAFSTMFSVLQKLSILPVLQTWFPLLRLVPTERTRKVQAAQHTMARIGKGLLVNAKSAAWASATDEVEFEKHNLCGRDLLSLLVKANMATDVPQSQRLSDKDVLAQIPTFILAGHDTTCMAITWALYAMTQAPEVQVKLREEVLAVNTDTPPMDDLMGLAYLDAIVRETLRVYPPVPATGRIAMNDDVLPVEKPFTDKRGVVHDAIRVRKGDAITISFVAINHSKALWGPDAHEFRPERWMQVPETASQIPGVWSNLLTFGGGPKGCIGYRFALVEMKVILFTLIRTFKFELGVPPVEVRSKTAILQRPILRSDPMNKVQLPLLISQYQRERMM